MLFASLTMMLLAKARSDVMLAHCAEGTTSFTQLSNKKKGTLANFKSYNNEKQGKSLRLPRFFYLICYFFLFLQIPPILFALPHQAILIFDPWGNLAFQYIAQRIQREILPLEHQTVLAFQVFLDNVQ